MYIDMVLYIGILNQAIFYMTDTIKGNLHILFYYIALIFLLHFRYLLVDFGLAQLVDENSNNRKRKRESDV